MPYVTIPGVNLWYEDTGGTGTPVIFLHAASGNCDCWVYQLPSFISANYRCITYDRRWWGRSQSISGEGETGYMSDDLNGLADHLQLERFHLVATAAGGITGLDYALEQPERVRSLVAANTIGGVQDTEYLEVQRRLRPPEIQALPVELRELGPSYRGTDPDGASRWLEIDHASRQASAPAEGQPRRRPITSERLATMRVAVLMLLGGADLLSPPALMRMLMQEIFMADNLTAALTVPVEQPQPAFEIFAVEITAGHAAPTEKGGTGV